MRLASTNAGKFKNLDVEMQKTPVNKGVFSLLNSSKQVQNGLPVTFRIVAGLICDDLPVIGIQEIAKASRAVRPSEPLAADESPKAAFNDTSAGLGPDFADSSRFHSAPFQRRPVNHSTGPRFHACRAVAWRRQVRSATPPQIAEDRLPRRRDRVSSRQVPSAARPRIKALSKLPPSRRPQSQSDLWCSGQVVGLTPAHRPPGDGPRLTRPTRRGPAPQKMATRDYGLIAGRWGFTLSELRIETLRSRLYTEANLSMTLPADKWLHATGVVRVSR